MIESFIAQFLAPLSLPLLAAAISAGLFFGGVYNRMLNLPTWMIYHKLMAGWGFLLAIFLFRLGSASPNFAGWLGIAALWGIFCLFIYVGEKLSFKIRR